MVDTTSLGDRMKLYENMTADKRVMPLTPVMARLDGRSFHTFCRGLTKPFDEAFHRVMAETARFLVEETNALIAYTQSDEITLVWYSEDIKSQVFFDGRIQKMVSVLAGLATAKFNRLVPIYLPDKANMLPVFDCRVWTVPTLGEATNAFIWRGQDATRNSIQAAGQAHFSHTQLQGKNQSDIQEMLHAEGINWNDYPAWAKRGTWVQKTRVVRTFTTDEMEKLPPKHEVRTNPNLQVERWAVREVDMPPLSKVWNRDAVIFRGASPIEGDKYELRGASALESLMLQEDQYCLQELERLGTPLPLEPTLPFKDRKPTDKSNEEVGK
jgi:tRNA(His) guanylyltransferase